MPPPYPLTWRVACEGINGNEVWANVFHVRSGGAESFDSLADNIAAEFGAFYTNITSLVTPNRGTLNLHGTDWRLTRIAVKDLTVAAGDTFEQLFDFPGTGSGDQTPVQVAMVCSLKTAVASRRGRGRVFLNGFLESGMSDAGTETRFSGASIVDVAEAFADLDIRLSLVGAGFGLAVLSELDAVSRPVTAVRIDAIPRTQRRRANKLRGVYTIQSL